MFQKTCSYIHMYLCSIYLVTSLLFRKDLTGITEWLKTMVVVVSRWMKGDDDDDVDDSDNFNDPNWK